MVSDGEPTKAPVKPVKGNGLLASLGTHESLDDEWNRQLESPD